MAALAEFLGLARFVEREGFFDTHFDQAARDKIGNGCKLLYEEPSRNG